MPHVGKVINQSWVWICLLPLRHGRRLAATNGARLIMAAKKLIGWVRDHRTPTLTRQVKLMFVGSALCSAIQWWRFGFPRINVFVAMAARRVSLNGLDLHPTRANEVKALAEKGDALGQGSTVLGVKRRLGKTCDPAAH
jgi:hypothetical protein